LVLVTPLRIVEVKVFLVSQGHFESEAPVPSGCFPEIEVRLPAMKIPGELKEVVVEGAIDQVIGGPPVHAPALGKVEAEGPLEHLITLLGFGSGTLHGKGEVRSPVS
jgi:hypothetical protein